MSEDDSLPPDEAEQLDSELAQELRVGKSSPSIDKDHKADSGFVNIYAPLPDCDQISEAMDAHCQEMRRKWRLARGLIDRESPVPFRDEGYGGFYSSIKPEEPSS